MLKPVKKKSEFARVMKQLAKNKLAILGLIILLAEIILCAGAPLFTKYGVAEMDYMSFMDPTPSAEHIFELAPSTRTGDTPEMARMGLEGATGQVP